MWEKKHVAQHFHFMLRAPRVLSCHGHRHILWRNVIG